MSAQVKATSPESLSIAKQSFPLLNADQGYRLWGIVLATLAAYSSLPADWVIFAAKVVEQCSPREDATESWLAQLKSKRGVHLFAQLGFGAAHRDTADGLFLMIDAVCRLQTRKRSDPRDDRLFQEWVAPYFRPDAHCVTTDGLRDRITGTWSGKKLPDPMRDDDDNENLKRSFAARREGTS